MKRKLLLAFIFSLLVSASIPSIKRVYAIQISETIYIKADGSIYPPNAPLTTRDGITYTLTSDISVNINTFGSPSIAIERDNIILDGNGHEIVGTGWWIRGIVLVNRKNVTIRNIKISRFRYGIYLKFSHNNTIINSTLSRTAGIFLHSSLNNVISNNIFSSNDEYSIYLELSPNNTITNNTFSDNTEDCIYMVFSPNNTIANNIFSNSRDGVYLSYSSNSNIVSNVFTDSGLFILDSYFNTVKNNTVNGKPLVYLENASDKTINDAGQVILVRCKRIRVEKLKISKTTIGIELLDSNDCIITSNVILGNRYGIKLDFSSNNLITNNLLSNNKYESIYLSSSSNNTIANNAILNNFGIGIISYYSTENVIINNIISMNHFGIEFDYSSKNVISNNVISRNLNGGIGLFNSSNNVITRSTISDNGNEGIHISSSNNNIITDNIILHNFHYGIFPGGSNNIIYHNDIISNPEQVRSCGYFNIWDNGYPSGGNYWSDYSDEDNKSGPNQDIYGSDGIWDHPYVMDSKNKDRYPSVKPYFPYKVNVLSPYLAAIGSGWYKEESSVRISIVPATIIDHENGTRHVFSGWYENNSMISIDPSFVITVNRSMNVVAHWNTEYEVKVSSIYGNTSGSGWYTKGSLIIVSVSPVIIYHNNGTRRVFKGWYEINNSLISANLSFSMIVDKPISIVAKWDTEYLVNVSSPYGRINGSGWYRPNVKVTVSLSPTSVEKDFFTNNVFEGWKIDEKTVSILPTYSFIIDKPVTIRASWRTEVKPFLIGLIIGLIIFAPAIILMAKKKHKPSL
ncbi:MAG: right-handed parallel beta-helix repeat-containing protein [Ignisphaera sp.]